MELNYKAFCLLDKWHQVEFALKCGVEVGEYHDQEEVWVLYFLEDFYIELLYVTGDPEVVAIKHSDDERVLEPYLEGIDISGLYLD